MGTTIKKFLFSTSTEGWAFYATNNYVEAGWFVKAGKKNSRNEPKIGEIKGSLRATARRGNPDAYSDNYWILEKSWTDLGVTSGLLVSKVRMDYLYRFHCPFPLNFASRRCYAEFHADTWGIGGSELLFGGSQLGVFSDPVYAPPRGVDNYWAGYPAGNNSQPIVDEPESWGKSEGSIVEVPEKYQDSGTSVQFMIRLQIPALDNFSGNFLRSKIDRIVITLTHNGVDPIVGGVDPLFFSGD